jgi:Mg-chelatase subunit ChlD
MSTQPNEQDRETLTRWRLVLGKEAEQHGMSCEGNDQAQQVEELIGFLFQDVDGEGREGQGQGQGRGRSGRGRGKSSDRKGGQGKSTLSIPDWVSAVHELFPRQVKEVMERELVQRRGIAELLQTPDLLEKIEPNPDIVKTLLTHKNLLTPETRVLARKIIKQVVDELKEKIKVSIEQAITGAIRRDRHSPRKVYRNLDLKTTLRRNLRNYDHDRDKLLVDRLYFYAAERKKRPWHIVLAVDQSGSMLESAIFSAVMASIFAELPAVKTSMFLFDTQIADLTDKVGEPVDVLLSVQLGGGTNIAMAMHYAETLVREPARTIVVLITDFYEGGNEQDLVEQTANMAQAGIRLIGLGALGYDARPSYNKETAKKMRKVGMDILVCTPEKLAECMGQIIRG